MNFSKLKLNESIAKGDYTGLSAEKATSELAGASSQNKFNRNSEVKSAKTKLSSQPVGTKNTKQTVMSSHIPDVDKYFSEMRAEVERIKSLQSQKSDWRTELQEKAVDGVEREGHPFVTVMPTGDEALIQAMKQMGGEVQEKKKKLQSSGVDVNLQKEEALDEVAPAIALGAKVLGKTALGLGKAAVGGAVSGAGSAVGGALSGAGSAVGGALSGASKNNKDKNKSNTVDESVVELEEKKKGCKDGYKRDEDGNCVKKEKSKTFIMGRGYGYGHHHHDHDESPDEGGDGDGGGDGGGGMGEMFDILGDMLLKEMKLRDAQKMGMTKPSSPKPVDHRKLNAARTKGYVPPKTSNKDRAKD